MNYTETELSALGLRFGRNIAVHRSVEFFGADRITLGSNVRIDCFCVLSAKEPMTLGNHVHLGVGACLFGSEGSEIGDFGGLSNRRATTPCGYSLSDANTHGSFKRPWPLSSW